MTPLTKDLFRSNEGLDIFTESESQDGNPGPDRVACNEGPLVRPVRWETHWRTKLLRLAVPYPFDRTVRTLFQGGPGHDRNHPLHVPTDAPGMSLLGHH